MPSSAFVQCASGGIEQLVADDGEMTSQPEAATVLQHSDVHRISQCSQDLAGAPWTTDWCLGSAPARVRRLRYLRWFPPRSGFRKHPLDYRCFLFVRRQLLRPIVRVISERNTAGESQSAGLQPRPRIRDPRGDQLSLELGEGCHDVQHEVVLCGVAKLRRGDDDESHFEPPKLVQQRHAVPNTSRQTVQSVNEDLIDDAATDNSEQPVQPRTVERRAGVAVVIESLWQHRPLVPALRLKIQGAGLVLDFARRQTIRRTHRLAGVDRAPNRPSAQRLFGGMEH